MAHFSAPAVAPTLASVCTPSRASLSTISSSKPPHEALEKPTYKAPSPTSAAEREMWDHLSELMSRAHDHFRAMFRRMWALSDSYASQGYSVGEFMGYCQQFERTLHMHHGLEEAHLFPLLAETLPEFGEEHPEEHEAITAGLDKLSAYVKKCKQSPREYNAETFKDLLAAMGPILFHHLDAEVETLKGDNLRRYYSLSEFKSLQRRLPF